MRRLLASQRLFPASGGFNAGNVRKVLRLTRMGCSNRPFYHIVVGARRREQHDPCIEQVGSYDPMPNERNEKLVALNCERIAYWLGQGVKVSRPLAMLLGIGGYFPIHPRTYMTAWRNRKSEVEKAAAEKAAAEEAAAEQAVAADSNKEKPAVDT